MSLDYAELLQLTNVLIIPALIFVVRIDRRMGQIDALSSTDTKRIDKVTERLDDMADRLARAEARMERRHA